MPKIIVQANQSDANADQVTLTERVVASHLQDEHYAAQLIERLTWAALDAERLELPEDGDDGDEHHRPQTHPIPDTRQPASPHMTPKRPIAVMGYPFYSGRLGRCRWLGATTRGRTRSCCRGSRTTQRAWTTSSGCAGLTGCDALGA